MSWYLFKRRWLQYLLPQVVTKVNEHICLRYRGSHSLIKLSERPIFLLLVLVFLYFYIFLFVSSLIIYLLFLVFVDWLIDVRK